MKTNLQQFITFLLLLVTMVLHANNIPEYLEGCSNNMLEIRASEYFPADIDKGLIGESVDKPVDNPGDNVFQITLDALPETGSKIWLTYDLYGVEDHTGISRSINDELAQGGYLVKKSHEWRHQRELLHANWLKNGVNNIRFSIPENVDYNYEIRNLGILVEYDPLVLESPTVEVQDIVINQPETFNYYENKAYFKGFITGKNSDRAKIYIDGKEISTRSSRRLYQ